MGPKLYLIISPSVIICKRHFVGYTIIIKTVADSFNNFASAFGRRIKIERPWAAKRPHGQLIKLHQCV